VPRAGRMFRDPRLLRATALSGGLRPGGRHANRISVLEAIEAWEALVGRRRQTEYVGSH